MKKLLSAALLAASIGFVTASSAEAKTTESAITGTKISANLIEPQRQNRRRDNRRAVRVVTQSRIVGFGRQRYRETYRITYLPNGRTRTQLISRVRVR